MQNGHCPKCNSTEIYRGTRSPFRAGEGMLHLEGIAHNTGINILLDACVCAQCGYVEMYVTEQSRPKLASLVEDKNNWQKVG